MNQLCVSLLEDISTTSKKIGVALTNHNNLSAFEISSFTKIAENEVRQNLQILTQLNFVSFFAKASTKSKKQITQFSIDRNALLLRYLDTEIMMLVSSSFGSLGELVIESLLVYSVLTFPMLCEIIRSKSNVNAEQIRKTFKELCVNHFIVQRSKSEKAIATKPTVEPSVSTTRKRKLPSTSKTENKRIKIDKQTTSVRNLLDLMNVTNENEVIETKQEQKTFSEENDADFDAVLWTVNYIFVVEHLKHKAYLRYISEKFGFDAAEVFRLFITATKSGKQSVELTELADIIAQSDSAVSEFNLKKIQSFFGIFQSEPSEPLLIRKTTTGTLTYSFNDRKVSQFLRLQIIRSTVSALYGAHSLRIFNICLEKKLIEAKPLADLALLPQKDCKEIVHTMVKERFLQIQEVPKGNDHFPSDTFFLYTIKINETLFEVQQRLCHSLLRIREFRLHLEEKIGPNENSIKKARLAELKLAESLILLTI